MSESRLCPVCEKEIPADARFLCPHCHFELKWLEDEIKIENAKQDFPKAKFEIDETEVFIEKQERKYYVSGLIGSAIPGFFILVLVFWSLGMLLWIYALPVWLLGGLPAGYIGNKLGATKETSSSGLSILTMILGFLFATIIGIAFVIFLF